MIPYVCIYVCIYVGSLRFVCSFVGWSYYIVFVMYWMFFVFLGCSGHLFEDQSHDQHGQCAGDQRGGHRHHRNEVLFQMV